MTMDPAVMARLLAEELEHLHDAAYRVGAWVPPRPEDMAELRGACELARLTLGSYADATRTDLPDAPSGETGPPAGPQETGDTTNP
jgi:hypothetical protein